MAEKRTQRRRKSLLHGYVYFDDSPCAAECVVREITDAGARLKFATPLLPVESFELDIPMRGQKLRAEVKWQRGTEMGVAFAGELDVPLVPAAVMTPAQAAEEDLEMRVMRLETEIAALRRLVKRLGQKINGKVEAA